MAEQIELTTETESVPSAEERAEPLDEPQHEEPEATESPLDSQLDTLTAALSERDARISELEAALGEAESAVSQRVEEIEGVNARLAQAVEMYRASLLAAEPDVPEDMVQGASVEAVQESLERARQMVAQVRGRLEAQTSLERTPLGTPARSAPDLSALSPQEKILMGLSGR